MIFRSVVLPQPLGPRMTRVSPSNTDRSRSRMEKVELRPPDEPDVARSPPRSVAQMLISSIRAMRTAQSTRATDDSATSRPTGPCNDGIFALHEDAPTARKEEGET